MFEQIWLFLSENVEGVVALVAIILGSYGGLKIKGVAGKILINLPDAMLVLFGIKKEDAPGLKKQFINDSKAAIKKNILSFKEKILNAEIKLGSKILTEEQRQKAIEIATEAQEILREDYGIVVEFNANKTT